MSLIYSYVTMLKSDTEKVLMIFHLKIYTQAYLEAVPFGIMEKKLEFVIDLNFCECSKTAHL